MQPCIRLSLVTLLHSVTRTQVKTDEGRSSGKRNFTPTLAGPRAWRVGAAAASRRQTSAERYGRGAPPAAPARRHRPPPPRTTREKDRHRAAWRRGGGGKVAHLARHGGRREALEGPRLPFESPRPTSPCTVSTSPDISAPKQLN